jgi:trimethylamine--corrinoid protein Co-methyltransferase
VDEATLALDAIRDVGPGGLFVDHPHTVRRYRKEHWLPEIWSRDMLATWEARGRISAEDRARDRWEVLRRSAPAYSGVTEEDERVLGQVVERAQRALCR